MKRNTKSGFSLVEVAIALGVLSFVIVPILGLMGTGLSTARDAALDMAALQIRQRVESDMRQMTFASISQTAFSTNYSFSKDGRALQSGDPSFAQNALYKVQVKNSPLTGVNSGMTNALVGLKVVIQLAPGGVVQTNAAGYTNFLIVSKDQ